MSAGGNKAVVRRDPAKGKRMEMTGITIKRLSGGKIAEAWTNFDALGMMRQLGLIPEAATHA